MLFYETIESNTLDLLKKIQQKSVFHALRLVGGTSLALQIGHRISVDLDLFGELKTDRLEIVTALKQCGSVTTLQTTANIHTFVVNDIKVDIVNYTYPWIGKPIVADGVSLSAIEDIVAMKLAAVTGRGSKKDFIDIYFLLNRYSLDEMLSLYQQKFSEGSIFLVLKSLSYFEDAEKDVSPKMLVDAPWDNVKKRIIAEVKKYAA